MFIRLVLGLIVLALSTTPSLAVKGHHSGILQLYSGPTATQTCALLADARALCWGGGHTAVMPLDTQGNDVREISLGADFGCLRVADGRAFCWGNNGSGQLGTGDAHATPAPVRYETTDFGNVAAIAAGGAHVCAARMDGSVWCWGSNQFGQLGNFTVGVGSATSKPVWVVVHDGSDPALSNAVKITSGYDFSCALLADDTGACWGNDSSGELANDWVGGAFDSPQTIFVQAGSGYAALTMGGGVVAAGGHHACGLIADVVVDSVGCWGLNDYGELGIGNRLTKASAFPAQDGVSKITNAIAIAGGEYFMCALLVDLTAICWGSNAHDQIANTSVALGANQLTGIPVMLTNDSALSGIVQLVAGQRHVCALTVANDIYCWGDNSQGQLGTDSSAQSNTPITVVIDAGVFTDNFDGN